MCTGDRQSAFFDSNTTAEISCLIFISYHFHMQNGEGLSDMEYRNQQYYTAGIIRDDLSNNVTVYGIHAKDTDYFAFRNRRIL